MSPNETAKYLTSKQACDYCRISRRTLSRWQRHGRVDYARINRRMVLFPRASLDRMIEAHMVKASR